MYLENKIRKVETTKVNLDDLKPYTVYKALSSSMIGDFVGELWMIVYAECGYKKVVNLYRTSNNINIYDLLKKG